MNVTELQRLLDRRYHTGAITRAEYDSACTDLVLVARKLSYR